MNSITGSIRDQGAELSRVGGKFTAFSREASAAMIGASRSASAYNREIRQLADTIGQDIEKVNAWGQAFKKAGSSVSDYVQIAAELNNLRRRAFAGNASEEVENLKKSGVIKNIEDLKDEDQVLKNIIQRYREAETMGGGRGSRFLITNFGRDWTKHSETLRRINTPHGGDTSGLFTKKDQILADQLADSRDRINNSLQEMAAISHRIVTPALLAVSQAEEKVVESAKDLQRSMAPFLEWWSTISTKVKLIAGEMGNWWKLKLSGMVADTFDFFKDMSKGLDKFLRDSGILITREQYEAMSEEERKLHRLKRGMVDAIEEIPIVAKAVSDKTKTEWDTMMDEMEKRASQDMFGNILEQLLNLPQEAAPPLMSLMTASIEEIGKMAEGMVGKVRLATAPLSDIMSGSGWKNIEIKQKATDINLKIQVVPGGGPEADSIQILDVLSNAALNVSVGGA